MEIPKIGFGTYRLKGKTVYESVLAALRIGYRHIDTANLYGNEKEIGDAILTSKVKREEIWITTKIKVKDIEKGKDTMRNSVVESLSHLKTEYIDLVLLHGPADEMKSWKHLEEIYFETRKIRYIGVSNYDIPHLQEIKNCKVKPYVNQFEVNPYLDRNYLINYCQRNSIIVVAHSSLVKGEKFFDEKLKALEKEYNISSPKLLLAWALSKNLVVIPRSSKEKHICENFFQMDIDISILTQLNTFDENYITHPQYVFQKEYSCSMIE